MSTLPRDVLVRAFNGDQRAIGAFEELDAYLSAKAAEVTELLAQAEDATNRLTTLESAENQTHSPLLDALSNLPDTAGAIEMLGGADVTVRGIDSTDDACLISRGQADARYSPLSGSATPHALTFSSAGAGAAPGSSFNGGLAVTISYNSVGAAASVHTHASTDITGLGYFATGTDAANLTGTLAAGSLPAFAGGDVTSLAGSAVLTIGANKVTRGMLAQTAAAAILGATAAGNVTDLTPAQAKTILAITAADVSGLAAVATSGSASDLTTGTLPTARLPDTGCLLKISGMTFALNAISNATTLAGVADRHQLFPWTPDEDLTITAIGVECQTAVASANAKVVVYDTSATTRGPNNLLKETTNLDCSTTGYKSVAWAFTFLKGVTYWVGVRTSSTATLRATTAAGMPNIGRQASTGTGTANMIQKTLAFATAASNPYGAVPVGNLQSNQAVYDVIATLA